MRRPVGIGLAVLLSASLCGCSPVSPPGSGASGAIAASSTLAAPVPAARPLTATDVRAVLDAIANPDPTADFRVDVRRFAVSVVGQMPLYVDSAAADPAPTAFPDPYGGSQRALSAAESSAAVARASEVFAGIARAKGEAAAEAAMNSVGMNGKAPTRDEKLLYLLQEGTARLTFMFGTPDPAAWTWKVTGVSVTGTDTADVTYDVATPAKGMVRFKRTTFVKHLQFEPRADGVWVLAGWLDYPAFERAVKGSIVPADEIPNLVPNWWDTLGAAG